MMDPASPLRWLGFSALRALSELLDPQDAWRSVAANICLSSGEPRYSQLHIRRFEAAAVQGKSPTAELLFDWGTSGCSVADLMELLTRLRLFAALAVLEGGGASEEGGGASDGFLRLSERLLAAATDHWAPGRRVGAGGFGEVFRARLESGVTAAVKRLNPLRGGGSDEDLQTLFSQEMDALRRLSHENVVNLLGVSSGGRYRCLIYEFMSNGSLLERLACEDSSASLTWSRRCSISAGAARGLQYLHQNQQVHRDVKSGNILLDECFVAKISDFGLTRTHSRGHTRVTERIMGTAAYMAPEALRGEITPESDVFSFGVVLLEILSGRPPVDESKDPALLVELLDDEEDSLSPLELCDVKMEGWTEEELQQMFDVATQCLRHKKNRRASATQVACDLENLDKTCRWRVSAHDLCDLKAKTA